MTRRGAVWGAGVGVLLAAASSALINQLDAGWPWWVACAVVVLAAAGLTMWQASGDRGAPSASEINSELEVDEVDDAEAVNVRIERLDPDESSINAKTRAGKIRRGGKLIGMDLGTVGRDPGDKP